MVETKAPAGYALLATPVEVEVTSADTSVATATIANTPTNGNLILPLTGGSISIGSGIAYIAGALLLASAIIAVIRWRRGAASSDSE